ncbi:MAG: hypothetical protein AMJ90_07940 [candidate division Zixibacteria bacterium SM23_73_2]|nr:MAG: hypothetical protein AMJ90_07940 [candidate division Zixibacteria bacterium SM23_73_2]
MPHTISKQSYSDLRNGLTKTKQWLIGLNIPFDKSRFGQYEKNVELLDEHYKKGEVKELLRRTDFEDIVVSLNESTELVEIYEQLKYLNPELLRKKLKLIIGGPFLTKNESSEKGTNLARNIFYELYTMAVLKHAGFEILPELPSDVAFTFESKIILFECKRPQTKGSVESNFFKAVKQLTKNLNSLNELNSKGIVSISVSKILNRGDKLLIGRDQNNLANKIDSILGEIVRENKYLYKKVIDPRIIGVFYHLNTPAVNQQKNELINVQQIMIDNICLFNSSDYLIIERMASLLVFKRD